MTDQMAEDLSAVGLEETPGVVVADAGYGSGDNLEHACASDLDELIATGRLNHHERMLGAPREPIPNDAARSERMARRLRTKKRGGRALPGGKRPSKPASPR